MIEMEWHFQGEDYRLGRGVEVSADDDGLRVNCGDVTAGRARYQLSHSPCHLSALPIFA
jgi:hypothetical protein